MSRDSTRLNLEIESDSFPESEPSCLSFEFSMSLLPVTSCPKINSFIESNKNNSTSTKDNLFKDVSVPEMPDTIIANSDEEDEDEGEFGVVVKKSESKNVQDDDKEDKDEDNNPDEDEDVPVKSSSSFPVDLLNITFKKNGDLPFQVEKHIESKIGMFQKNFNKKDNTMTLTFEVNFHQIDKAQIWQSYQRFFEQSSDDKGSNMHFKLSFDKKGTMDNLLDSFKTNPEIPLVLHLLENSRLKLESTGPDYLIKTGMNYLKSGMKHEMAFLEFLLSRFKGIEGKMQLGPLKDISKDFWNRLELDQTQNFGGFFDVWRTPLLRYVFAEGEGTLVVKGTVFNFFAYEFKMKVNDFAKFLADIKEEFK